MISALEVDRKINLSPLIQALSNRRVWHRINETGATQVVWVQSETARSEVLALYEQMQRGELVAQSAPSVDSSLVQSPLVNILRAPLTLTVILANLICFPVTLGVDEGQVDGWFHWMTFLDFQYVAGSFYFADLGYTLESGQFWRFLTPMFLHFGLLHIVFNLLWVWEVGRRIEWFIGGPTLFLVMLLSSMVANLTQYLVYGASLFGGMSGVVFGLLGFALVWSRLVPERNIGLPIGVYIVMLAFLILGFTGAFDLLGLGSLANGAHLGGLVAGLVIALPVAFQYRFYLARLKQ